MNAAIASLIDELERDSRERSRSLEALGRLPFPFVEVYHPLTPREVREMKRLWAAMAMTDDVDVFCALARGEIVPEDRLRPEIVAAHWRREQGS